MKTVDLGRLSSSSAKKITSVIGKKLKENRDSLNKIKSKIDLGKLAEKLAERKEKAMADAKEEDGDKE